MNIKRFIVTVLLGVLLVGAYYSWDLYNRIYSVNVVLEAESVVLRIPTGADFEDVVVAIDSLDILLDLNSFMWVSQRKKYPSLIKPGRYVLLDGMNNNRLVNLLRSGEQSPINVVIRSVRTKTELAGLVGKNLELDSLELLEVLNSTVYGARYGFSQTTFITMFLPNTYEFYWNTNVDEFM